MRISHFNLFSISKKQGLILGSIIIFIYILPYIIFGENSFITIHDFLDSSIAHIKAVFDNDSLLDENKIIPILSGLPRSSFFSIFDIKIIPFLFLSPYWAIVVNTFLIKITAFLGLYLLLDKHVLNKGENKNLIITGISLCFAFIPFYVDYGISSAGIPIVLYAFLNLHKKNNIWSSYLIIIYFGLYSSLVLSGLFLCISLFIYFLYLLIKEKKLYFEYLLGLGLLSIIYIVININLLVSHFGTHEYISHRSEFYSETSFNNLILNVLRIIKNSQYHAGSFNGIIIIALFIYIWYKYHKQDKVLTKYLAWFLFIIGFIFIAYMMKWLFPSIEIFRSFQFDRFYFLFPCLCFVLFAVSLQKIFIKTKALSILLMVFMLLSTLNKDQELKYFVKSTFSLEQNIVQQPSYKQFYDVHLFNTIENSISSFKRTDYKIICLGIFPAVLEYNGYHTIDSYFYDYPLSYKHKFRPIIIKELDKSELLKDYFDNWGSRCYLFSSELGQDYLWGKDRDGKVSNLEINTDVLKEMDCSYIFSAVEIENYENLNLQLVGEYTTSESYWNIYVYKV